MQTNLEVLFTPADFDALRHRDLTETVCVVFDVLRATTSMVTALANGAAAIIPVGGIPEAVNLRRLDPAILLAGERDGLRIQAELAGAIPFDLGNSPTEFTSERVLGRIIAMTTTNGTRALRACAHARTVLVSCFLNLSATAEWIENQKPTNLVLVCSGTYEQAAYEDALAAGALCDRLWPAYGNGDVADSAMIARQIFCTDGDDLVQAMGRSRNGRRLLANPSLRGDVSFCSQRDTCPFVVELENDGRVRKHV